MRSGMSREAPVPVLYTHFGEEWIRGSETLLLDLISNLDPGRHTPIVWCNGREMAEACRAAGFTTYRSPFAFYGDAGSPRFSPAGYAALIREGAALARAHKVSVLHANSAAPTQWLLPVARNLRLPLVSHLHTGYLRRSRYALLIHQADLIVGVSRQVLEGPLADGVPPGRTQVIYNGIDFARLDATREIDLRAALGIAADVVLIAAAGSLIPRKGFDVLIRSLAQLDGPPPPQLLIAGDGPEREALHRLAASLGIGGRVHFLGFQRRVADVYLSADIFALPSRAEAFGLVLAEAGYEGLPVVATRVGGLPEVVVDGTTGLLVPPDDPESLAAALASLAADPALRARLGQAGRDRATTLFSVQRMAGAFADAYDRLTAIPAEVLGWRAVPARARPWLKLVGGR